MGPRHRLVVLAMLSLLGLVDLRHLSGVLASGQTTPDYPQWRGPLRDGSATAFDRPEIWPAQLSRRWTVQVGEGYATPLVIGDAIYAFTRRDGAEVVSALDASTGQELWSAGYPAPYTPSAPAAAHGAGPKATPAFDRAKVFTLGITGVVAAFDASTGELLWRTRAPSEPPFFSAASSPVAEDGLVFAHPGNYEPLTAFDAETGDVRWIAGSDGFFASPRILTLGDERQVVTMTQEDVIGVSLADGEILWRFPWATPGGAPMPAVNGDTLIVSGFDQGMSAFRPVKNAEAWSVQPLWETNDVSLYLSHPVVIGNVLFGFSRRASGQFFALDAQSGETLWLGPPRQATSAAIVKANGALVLLQDDGELLIARSSRTGFEAIQRYTVGDGGTWAQPVFLDNRLLIKDGSALTLWAFD